MFTYILRYDGRVPLAPPVPGPEKLGPPLHWQSQWHTNRAISN